ncbi:ABC transporter substrate-binding protein [Aquincola sp. S2]|uniref:ABC transporter substrate-binding protein n=1 Tax=Pseudaquabacterium terrae TaxID=2732868 RepID=A0ABX2EJH6_9BURK|nr:ABC transporter substrate-binding protein [Aquabacterium terrae]NRF68740.1 ABC transporter substrate-binding protein [Aquabacterium terrae]
MKRCAVCTLLLLLLAAGVACAQATLLLTTEESPPYNLRQGQEIGGSSTEKVRELMRRARQPHRIELLPWKRAYELALEQPDTCVYSTTRTSEREGLFKWVGPIAFNEWVLFGRSEGGIRLSTLEDARPYVIGAYLGDVREEYLRSRGFRVESVPSDAQNPRKLAMGRIDLWVSGRYDGPLLIAEAGLTGSVKALLTFQRTELYLACNRQLPDGLIGELGRHAAALWREGLAAAIDARYERAATPR